jgi:hypothetical protein
MKNVVAYLIAHKLSKLKSARLLGTVVCTTYALFAMLALNAVVFGQDITVSDGIQTRSAHRYYIARVGVHDYTTNYQGPDAYVEIRRDGRFLFSNFVASNANKTYGVRTSVPNRRYVFTVYYRGRVASTTISASDPPKKVIFYFSSDGVLRPGR